MSGSTRDTHGTRIPRGKVDGVRGAGRLGQFGEVTQRGVGEFGGRDLAEGVVVREGVLQ